MADQFLGEIRVFGFNFPPTGWAQCNGQLLPITQNTALFTLLGTTYGGNGSTTFGLPDLQGSVAMQHGQGPGLSEYFLGELGGADSITLDASEIPAHTHAVRGQTGTGNLQEPSSTRSLARSGGATIYTSNASTNLVPMAFQSLGVGGSSLPHDNVSPVLVMNFCIAIQGIFPPRS
jgi:microcystin-dependent protein